MTDTSVRISDVTYSNLVKARGMLETFHDSRLSLDDAVYISSRFTYEVTRLLMKEMGESVIFASGESLETGYFFGPKGDWKFPPKFVEDLMNLTRVLLRKRKPEAAKKQE